ncbi:MAG: GNAT family N-acetyltransferase [Pseudoxanthomonas sp.]
MPPEADLAVAPVVETSRLRLYRFTLGDADAAFMQRLMNDADFIRHIGDRHIRSVEDARESLRAGPVACQQAHGYSMYRMCRTSDGADIGACGLVRRPGLPGTDLGYALLPEARGQGLAREAAHAMLPHARAVGLDALLAIVSPGNHASVRLLASLGFQPRGTVRLTPESPELNLFHRSL